MSKLEAIELQDLNQISGGQAKVGGEVEIGPNKAKVDIQTQAPPPERKSDYLTCLNDRSSEASWYESRQSITDRQREFCKPLAPKP